MTKVMVVGEGEAVDTTTRKAKEGLAGSQGLVSLSPCCGLAGGKKYVG